MTTTSIGGVYNRLGQFQQARKRLYQALAVAQQIGNRSIEPTLYVSIAFGYREQGQFEQARRNLQKSLNVARTIGSLTDESQALSGIGKLYLKQALPENALKMLQQVLKIQRQTGVISRQADTLSFVGQAQTQLRKYPEAQTTLQQALKIAKEIDDRSSEGIILSNIGSVFLQIGKASMAEKPLFEAIEVWESLRSGLIDSDKVSLFETQALTYRLLQQSLVIQQKNEMALEVSERSRARALVELLASRLLANKPSNGLKQENQQFAENPSIAQIQQVAKTQSAILVQFSIVSDKDLYIYIVQPNGSIQFRQVDMSALGKSLNQFVNASRNSLGVSCSAFKPH